MREKDLACKRRRTVDARHIIEAQGSLVRDDSRCCRVQGNSYPRALMIRREAVSQTSATTEESSWRPNAAIIATLAESYTSSHFRRFRVLKTKPPSRSNLSNPFVIPPSFAKYKLRRGLSPEGLARIASAFDRLERSTMRQV